MAQQSSVAAEDHARAIMPGAREVMRFCPGAERLERLVQALERAIDEGSPIAVDLAKSLVETCCKTILDDKAVAYSGSADLPALFRLTTQQLPLAEGVGNGRVRDAVRNTLNGLMTTVHGLCEIRNALGEVGHGQDAFAPSASRGQALLAARSADSIVCFLFRLHRGTGQGAPERRVSPTDWPEFNAYLDENNEVLIQGNSYKASEALYQLDLAAYREALLEFQAAPADDGAGG